MTEDFTTVRRVDQFIDVVVFVLVHFQVLDKAIAKICHNVPLDIVPSVYSQANSDDLLFIEVAFRKMIGQFREEAKVVFTAESDIQEEIIRKCTEDNIFEYLQQLDNKELSLKEKKELQDKQQEFSFSLKCSCGVVIDVNKMLAQQRMRLKKQLILSIEREIRTVSQISNCHQLYYSKMEADLKKVYNENKNDVARITKGIQYLSSVHQFVVCSK